jgi:hypothetical protein
LSLLNPEHLPPPTGLYYILLPMPKACAVGYILSPLQGSLIHSLKIVFGRFHLLKRIDQMARFL